MKGLTYPERDMSVDNLTLGRSFSSRRDVEEDRPGDDRDRCPDECWHAELTIVEGENDDEDEHEHRQRRQERNGAALDWNAEGAAERWLVLPEPDERRELQRQRQGVQEHVGDDEAPERDQHEYRVHDRRNKHRRTWGTIVVGAGERRRQIAIVG